MVTLPRDPDIDPKLLAIDPPGCGCTECMVGEYRPLQDASEAELRALAAGHLTDNTETHWTIEEHPCGDGWDIFGGQHMFTVGSNGLATPPPFEYYKVKLTKETYERLV
jgi:hypothetical protein